MKRAIVILILTGFTIPLFGVSVHAAFCGANSGSCVGREVGSSCSDGVVKGMCTISGNANQCVCKSSPICIPSECPNDYEPDFNCINKKLFDPSYGCCENKCKGSPSPTQIPSELSPLITIFGQTFAIKNGQQIPTLINLAISTVLGVISVYAVLNGIYLTGFKRANTTDQAEIEKINKNLTTMILGFILAWSFIIIIQLVSSLLGLGSLSNLTVIGGGDGGSTITIM